MRLVVPLLNGSLLFILVLILFYLGGQQSQVLEIILLYQVLVVLGDQILLLLLPLELILFIVSNFFDELALLKESLVGLVVCFLQILHVLLPLRVGVVIDGERPLRS